MPEMQEAAMRRIRIVVAKDLDGDCYMRFLDSCDGPVFKIEIPSSNLITSIRLCHYHCGTLYYEAGKIIYEVGKNMDMVS